MSENTHERTERADGVLLLTMIEAARVLSIGRTTMYELVGAGEIDVVHIGRRSGFQSPSCMRSSPDSVAQGSYADADFPRRIARSRDALAPVRWAMP